MTDTEILDWLEKSKQAVSHVPVNRVFEGWRDRYPNGYWRIICGRKDDSNRFQTLRQLVEAQQIKEGKI